MDTLREMGDYLDLETEYVYMYQAVIELMQFYSLSAVMGSISFGHVNPSRVRCWNTTPQKLARDSQTFLRSLGKNHANYLNAAYLAYTSLATVIADLTDVQRQSPIHFSQRQLASLPQLASGTTQMRMIPGINGRPNETKTPMYDDHRRELIAAYLRYVSSLIAALHRCSSAAMLAPPGPTAGRDTINGLIREAEDLMSRTLDHYETYHTSDMTLYFYRECVSTKMTF